jgi:hypothetical protein
MTKSIKIVLLVVFLQSCKFIKAQNYSNIEACAWCKNVDEIEDYEKKINSVKIIRCPLDDYLVFKRQDNDGNKLIHTITYSGAFQEAIDSGRYFFITHEWMREESMLKSYLAERCLDSNYLPAKVNYNFDTLKSEATLKDFDEKYKQIITLMDSRWKIERKCEPIEKQNFSYPLDKKTSYVDIPKIYEFMTGKYSTCSWRSDYEWEYYPGVLYFDLFNISERAIWSAEQIHTKRTAHEILLKIKKEEIDLDKLVDDGKYDLTITLSY